MQLSIISAGDKMPAWVDQNCDDYYRRLSGSYKVRQIELPLEKRSGNQSTEKTRQRETQRLLDAVPKGDWLVALDEKGKTFSTVEFASQLGRWREQGRNVSFLIGGPDGLDFSVDAQDREHWPDQRWSLSPLTFPHPLVRVILAEQLYRASTVIAGHPYHRS